MDREKRLRRVGLLCCHFARNCAYYKAGWNGKKTKATNEFWATVQHNYIDIYVLEWLKLFGDHNDKHHWKKVTEDSEVFKEKMLKHCSITEDDLKSCRESFKTYRDKFLAHLDSEDVMQIPKLDSALCVVNYYYSYVIDELDVYGLRGLPHDLELYYKNCFTDSVAYFGI